MMTIDRLIPDFGGLYRERCTGKLVRLQYAIRGRIYFLTSEAELEWRGEESFYEAYIHAGAAG